MAMETIDWQTVVPVGLALFIIIGSFLMMFTNFWTTAFTKKKNQ